MEGCLNLPAMTSHSTDVRCANWIVDVGR